MKVREWDEALAARVRNLVFQERQEKLLDALATRLRDSARIVVDIASTSRLRVPGWDEWLSGRRVAGERE